MPYDEHFAERIRRFLRGRSVEFYEKKMFSGVCFMVDDKMFCGTHADRISGESLLMCRVGDRAASELIDHETCLPMAFTGRVMKDFVYVTETGLTDDAALIKWLERCLDYNPVAKKSRKRS